MFKGGKLASFGKGIVRPFIKTPKHIVCPHFLELNWAYGCPFNCAYCYLRGTFRGKTKPRVVSLEHVMQALDEAFDYYADPMIFNTGELADSLAEFHDSDIPKLDPPRIVQLADRFEVQNKHKLLLLTKSHVIDPIIKRYRKQTIISFSINAHEAWKRWERRTPPPERRIEAARKASEAGYEVRIRIDPIFPIENWQEEYSDLIYLMLSELTPERITLGTPRGLRSTLKYSKDSSWKSYLVEESEWGKKLSYKVRSELYCFIIDKLDALGFDKSKIALCKERKDVWLEVGLDPGNWRHHYGPNWEKCACNCVW